LATHIKQLARLCFHTFGRVQHHHRAVSCHQCAVGVFGKILMARGVQQVDGESFVRKLQHSGSDGNAALLLHLHPVGCGGALVAAGADAASHMNGLAVEEQFLG